MSGETEGAVINPGDRITFTVTEVKPPTEVLIFATAARLRSLAPEYGWRDVNAECDPWRQTLTVTVSFGGGRGIRREYALVTLVDMIADPADVIAADFARMTQDQQAFLNEATFATTMPHLYRTPDPDAAPRAAHGPAWSAGTPRTAEEATGLLAQVETRDALCARMHHRMQRTMGNVVLEPSPRVTPGAPMPDATMPVEQWRATWRAAEVPVLCELRERCEASGARVVLPMDYSLSPPESVRVRYASRDATLGSVLWSVRAARSGSTIDDLCRVGEGGDGVEHVPIDAERWSGLQGPSYYIEVRGHPLFYVSRGWCPGLLSSDDADRAEAATPVDPATAAATWQAMRDACPERVYPEPSE